MAEHNRKMFKNIARLLLKYRLEKEKIVASSADIKRLTIKLAKEIKNRFDRPILPEPGETIAITDKLPKTVALFFDRVWLPRTDIDFPPSSSDMAIYGATELEIWLEAITLSIGEERSEKFLKLVEDSPLAKYKDLKWHFARVISESLFKAYGLIVTPVYECIESMGKEYQPGNIEVLFSSIKNIGIVDEKKLDWKQVEQIRKDSNARRKYRRMIHWLDTEMVGKSENYIADRIANKLEDYEWALKKHGIETVTGCLSRILDPKFIAASSAAVAGLAYAGDQFIAAIGGLGLLAGKAAITITKSALDIIDKRRGKDSEIAYVYEIKKKLK